MEQETSSTSDTKNEKDQENQNIETKKDEEEINLGKEDVLYNEDKIKEGDSLRIDPYKLKAHPKSLEIYGREEVDEELVASILEAGQLEAIVINQDHQIISGHRRWQALKKIKDETEEEEKDKVVAICSIRPFATDIEEYEAIVEFNRQRKKNALQQIREIQTLDEIFSHKAKRAKQNSINNLKRGSDMTDPTIREKVGGSLREKKAALLGIGTTKYNQLRRIGERYNNKDKNAILVVKEMNTGLSADAAEKKLEILDVAGDFNNPDFSAANKFLKEINKGLSVNQAHRKFMVAIEKRKCRLPAETRVEIPSGVFNVIVADPINIREAEKIQATEARDAALFLWAKVENIKERMKLMETWGFKLKAIGIWDTGKTSGEWFSGIIEFLLFGIKGDMKPPDTSKENVQIPNIIFLKGDTGSKSKYEYIYDVVEKMFPDEKWVDLYRANIRPGWGQPNRVEIDENLEGSKDPANCVVPGIQNNEVANDKIEKLPNEINEQSDDWL